MDSFKKLVFIGIILCGFLSCTIGHSYVTSPISRSNQRQSQSGCRGAACLGPCDVPLSRMTRAAINVARGDTITVQWPRNNHAGGFIRFAWAPTSQSDSHTAFDSNVQRITCHEVGGCGPSNPSDPNGGDSGPGDGSSRACTVTLTVPPHLTDGAWTLQWAWFGGAFALGDYYSCVDYRVSGGAAGSFTPSFVGGDYSYPGQQKCKFFNTDKLHRCINEPCDNPIYSLSQEKSGPVASDQLGSGVVVPASTSSSTSTSTTGRATSTSTSTSTTTGRATSTSTTTTGRASTSTSGRTSTSTSTSTGRTSSVVTGSSGSSSNCASATQASSSQATIISVDTWSSQLRAVVQVDASEALKNWLVEVTWPDSSMSVLSVYNAGALECQDTSHAVLKGASWSNNMAKGGTAQVEVIASNPNNRNSQYIIANTRLRVLTH